MSENSASQASDAEDIRPVVRTGASGNLGLWIFGVVLLFGGIMLFQALSSRRAALEEGANMPVASGGSVIAAPPPLSLPPGYQENRAAQDRSPLAPQQVAAPDRAEPPAPQVVTRIIEREVPAPQPAEPDPLSRPQPAIVFDKAVQPLAPSPLEAGSSERVLASRLDNPSLTVPKGTVIAAVLETALDSTRAGGARAIVSRDVMGFDGTHVLIPRGSRLYGEYQADVTLGQKRALIRWQRLTRPDAVIINLDSPAADPLGRAGVKGKVDSHFFARFGSAILQSVLDIGVGVATRKATDGVIVALPGSTQNVTGAQQAGQVQPTLTVRQGTSVSVFVARDLDFSTVER